MARWKIRKARYPIDPSKAWMAIPGGSIMRARRFATWRQAQNFVAQREKRRLDNDRDRIIRELDRDLGPRP